MSVLSRFRQGASGQLAWAPKSYA